MRLVNLGPIAPLSSYMLTTSSGKHLEGISHAHIVSLKYKLKTGAKGTDDLSTGFDEDCGGRQRKLTKNKTQKGKYHVKITLKYAFGFAEHQEKARYGLGYKLAITKNSDNSVLNEANATNNDKIKIIASE